MVNDDKLEIFCSKVRTHRGKCREQDRGKKTVPEVDDSSTLSNGEIILHMLTFSVIWKITIFSISLDETIEISSGNIRKNTNRKMFTIEASNDCMS